MCKKAISACKCHFERLRATWQSRLRVFVILNEAYAE